MRPTDPTVGDPRRLVLLRHGRSTGYSADTFSGWLDVPLSDQGKREAVRAGELLAEHGLTPDVVHTSLLSRAVATAESLLTAIGRPTVPMYRSWRLNERHYGALQGRSRSAVRAEVGDELFDLWRRSYEHAPPPAAPSDAADRVASRPRTESLADVRRRLEPYWRTVIAHDLHAGRVTLVVGHSNSLRALCMLLDNHSPREVAGLDVPTGIPLRYDLDTDLLPLRRGGNYLDPRAAAAGVAEVRAQGRRSPDSPSTPITRRACRRAPVTTSEEHP